MASRVTESRKDRKRRDKKKKRTNRTAAALSIARTARPIAIPPTTTSGQVILDHLPAGIALATALPGEKVPVSTKAYLSSEDGSDFIAHLEGVWHCFEPYMVQRGIHPSQVDHFLAIISPTRVAQLFCNELQQQGLMRSKRPFKAGESVFKDDIAGVEELEFHHPDGSRIEIPPDHGVVLILSAGWRKCLFYDYSVLEPGAPNRSIDIAKQFGRAHQYLLFQEMYSIQEQQWARMIDWGWFPFIWMNTDERKKVISFSTREEEPMGLFEDVCARYRSILPSRMEAWRLNGFLKEHVTFIETAAERYLAGDFLSSIQVLYPRIEGVMRKFHVLKRPGQRTQQGSMVEALVGDQDDFSLLLPQRFKAYLLGFYFRAFDEVAGEVPLSRHTVAHGASLPEDYDFVKASLGFMIFDQMFYYLK